MSTQSPCLALSELTFKRTHTDAEDIKLYIPPLSDKEQSAVIHLTANANGNAIYIEHAAIILDNSYTYIPLLQVKSYSSEYETDGLWELCSYNVPHIGTEQNPDYTFGLLCNSNGEGFCDWSDECECTWSWPGSTSAADPNAACRCKKGHYDTNKWLFSCKKAARALKIENKTGNTATLIQSVILLGGDYD